MITPLLAVLVLGAPPILQSRPRFYILAIGVKEYDYDKTGFGTLSGPRDAKLFVDGMKQWFGVDRSKGDVIEILDSPQQNTRAAIWAALERMAKNAKPDDAIVFFYSGHGTQVFDASKPTKQSQAIVPIDIKRKGGQAGDIIGESVITGPNFKTILAQLNAKKANNVTLFFDSCHSESISRGILRKKSGLPDAALANIKSRGETNLEKSDETGWELSQNLAIFSATRANWAAYESGEKGFFTAALINAMKEIGAKGGPVSYATVFDYVRADVRRRAAANNSNLIQEPQFEGNLDRQMFATTIVEQQPYYRVFVRGQSVKMEAGEVQGMREGMLFGLYPATTTNFSSAPEFLARIEFLEIDNETSISSLEIVDAKGDRRVMPDKSGLNRYRAVLIDGLPGGKAKVLLDAEVSGAASALLKDVKFMELVEKGKPYDLLVSAPGRSLAQLVNPSTAAWNISNAAGRVIASIEGESESEIVDRIKVSALNEAKRKTVLEIGPSGASQVQIEAELVPAITHAKQGARAQGTSQEATKSFQSVGTKSLALKTQGEPDANKEYRQSFVIRLRTVQKGPQVAYVPYITVLDITAKGEVTVLWPRPNTTNMERTLLPADGEWHYLGNDGIVDGKNPAHVYGMYVDSVQDGSGVEILKIIATERPENFRPLLTSGRSRSTEKSAAMKSPLARLLGSLWEGDPESSTARAGGNTAGASSNWAVAQLDLFVDIKP